MPLIMPTLQSELIGIYEKGPAGNPAPPLVAIKTATAYLNFVTPGVNAGAGSTIAMPGSIALGSDLTDLLSAPSPSASLFATKFATALNTYTSSATVIGIIPGTPPIPFSGPIG